MAIDQAQQGARTALYAFERVVLLLRVEGAADVEPCHEMPRAVVLSCPT